MARSQLHAHGFARRRWHLHQHICQARSRQLALRLLHRAHLLDGARQRTCEQAQDALSVELLRMLI